jgi:hypothetical protein
VVDRGGRGRGGETRPAFMAGSMWSGKEYCTALHQQLPLGIMDVLIVLEVGRAFENRKSRIEVAEW